MPAHLKADDERLRRNAPTFQWVNLPASGRQDPPPPLPSGRDWAPTTLEAWARLWSKPQALMWDPDSPDLVNWALLREQMLTDPRPSISAEMRAIHDRLGLNPKSMLQLKWRIVDEVDAPAAEPAGGRARKRYSHLKPVG